MRTRKFFYKSCAAALAVVLMFSAVLQLNASFSGNDGGRVTEIQPVAFDRGRTDKDSDQWTDSRLIRGKGEINCSLLGKSVMDANFGAVRRMDDRLLALTELDAEIVSLYQYGPNDDLRSEQYSLYDADALDAMDRSGDVLAAVHLVLRESIVPEPGDSGRGERLRNRIERLKTYLKNGHQVAATGIGFSYLKLILDEYSRETGLLSAAGREYRLRYNTFTLFLSRHGGVEGYVADLAAARRASGTGATAQEKTELQKLVALPDSETEAMEREYANLYAEFGAYFPAPLSKHERERIDAIVESEPGKVLISLIDACRADGVGAQGAETH